MILPSCLVNECCAEGGGDAAERQLQAAVQRGLLGGHAPGKLPGPVRRPLVAGLPSHKPRSEPAKLSLESHWTEPLAVKFVPAATASEFPLTENCFKLIS